MIYRRFGKTELAMPVLSFGCMRSMHGWTDTPLEKIPPTANDKLATIVRTALGHGINHIETAHGYGSSERQLGAVLAKIPRKDFILQTKVVASDDSEEFLRKVMTSMERLQVDRLDLLAIHGINNHRSLWQSCRKNGCLAAARRLTEKGIVDFVGFSGHGPSDVIIDALNHEDDGGFDFFNVHWYYILDANRKAIEIAATRDIGTFIISPSDKGGYLHTPSAKLGSLCSPLSPMLFNDIYCLRQHGVKTISIGASEPDHFDEHLKALAYLQDKGDEMLTRIENKLGTAMQKFSGSRRPDWLWDHLPPWQKVPGYINLRMIIWLYNLFHAWDMKQYARDRYAMLGTGSEWVPGNNGAAVEKVDFSTLQTAKEYSPAELKELVIKAHERLSQADPAP